MRDQIEGCSEQSSWYSLGYMHLWCSDLPNVCNVHATLQAMAVLFLTAMSICDAHQLCLSRVAAHVLLLCMSVCCHMCVATWRWHTQLVLPQPTGPVAMDQ